jgi:hypothetical protein
MKNQTTIRMIWNAAAIAVLTAICVSAAPQRPGCDLFPDVLESPRIKRYCESHDRAYEQNSCTIRSWLPRSGQPKDCAAANKEVFRRIGRELVKRTIRRIVRPRKPLFVPRMRW